MPFLLIELPADRDRCGHLVLLADTGEIILGPLSVAGRADDAVAAAAGNVGRDSLLPGGDTPTGTFRLRRLIVTRHASARDRARFGPCPVLVLKPTGGTALEAIEHGRGDVWVHGGGNGAGKLTATAGTLRLADDDHATLSAAVAGLEGMRCEIREGSGTGHAVSLAEAEEWTGFREPYAIHYPRRAFLPKFRTAGAVAASTLPAAAAGILDPGDSGDMGDSSPTADSTTDDSCTVTAPQLTGKVQPAVPPDSHFAAGIGADVNQGVIWQNEGLVLVPTLHNGGLPVSQGAKSGVTVAHGIDLGNWTNQSMVNNLVNSGLSQAAAQALADKFNGAYGLQGQFASTWLADHPGQIALTGTEANDLDQAFNSYFVRQIANQYNATFDNTFQSLPNGAQTTLVDIGFNLGTAGLFKTNLWVQVGSGQWDQALDNLLDFTPNAKDQNGTVVGSKSSLGQRAASDANLFKQAMNCGRPPTPPSCSTQAQAGEALASSAYCAPSLPPADSDPSDPTDVSAVPESDPNSGDPYGGYAGDGTDPYGGVGTDPFGGVGGDPNGGGTDGGVGGGGGGGWDPGWYSDPSQDPGPPAYE